MYTTNFCPYCVRALQFLNDRNVDVKRIYVDRDPSQFETMLQRSKGRRTVPQIFIDGYHVGGYDDMMALHRAGKLEKLLVSSSGKS